MLLDTFFSLNDAKKCAESYANGGKKHTGLYGKVYRVYHYHDNFVVVSGCSAVDFPARYGVVWAQYAV